MFNLIEIESLKAELRGEFDYSDLLRNMSINEILVSAERPVSLKFTGWEENWKEMWESRFNDRIVMYNSKHT